MSSIIKVVKGKVEEIELPEKVDVIVSEPIGFLLVSSFACIVFRSAFSFFCFLRWFHLVCARAFAEPPVIYLVFLQFVFPQGIAAVLRLTEQHFLL